MTKQQNIPKHWEIKKLGEVCEKITKGGTPTTYGFSFVNEGINFIKVENIENGKVKLDSIRNFISQEAHNFQKKSQLQENDLLFSIAGTIGETCLIKNEYLPANTNQALAILRGYIRYITPNYLTYQLNSSIVQYIKSKARGGAMNNISLEDLKNIDIVLPPLQEQEAIVAKIEELLSDLENGKQQLLKAQQQLKIYRQSLLKWAFEGKLTYKNLKEDELPEGWKIVAVGDICKCIVPNRDKPKSFNGNTKWVTTPNLSNNSIRLNYNEIALGLSDFEIKEYNARVIPVGGVIMTCVGTFGLSAIVEKPIVINQQLHAFISNSKVDAKYLAYCIQYNKNYFERKSTSTTIQYLNKENCNSMPLPLPLLPEQQKIVEILESKLTVCDKLEETISQSLAQAETLRQSILKRAFEGRLV